MNLVKGPEIGGRFSGHKLFFWASDPPTHPHAGIAHGRHSTVACTRCQREPGHLHHRSTGRHRAVISDAGTTPTKDASNHHFCRTGGQTPARHPSRSHPPPQDLGRSSSVTAAVGALCSQTRSSDPVVRLPHADTRGVRRTLTSNNNGTPTPAPPQALPEYKSAPLPHTTERTASQAHAVARWKTRRACARRSNTPPAGPLAKQMATTRGGGGGLRYPELIGTDCDGRRSKWIPFVRRNPTALVRSTSGPAAAVGYRPTARSSTAIRRRPTPSAQCPVPSAAMIPQQSTWRLPPSADIMKVLSSAISRGQGGASRRPPHARRHSTRNTSATCTPTRLCGGCQATRPRRAEGAERRPGGARGKGLFPDFAAGNRHLRMRVSLGARQSRARALRTGGKATLLDLTGKVCWSHP